MAGKKSSLAAVVLSLLVAGAGHAYLKSYKKAVLFFLFGEALSAVVYLCLDPEAGGMICLFASVYAAYDAYGISREPDAVKKEENAGGPDIRV
jgi:hypothetical protein